MSISFTEEVRKGMAELQARLGTDVQDELMPRIAKMVEITIRREMRGSGIKRSSETGTHLGRSASQKEKIESEGSILDLNHKVESYDERDIAFAGHAKHKGAYRARFQGDGTSVHYLWDSSKNITMANSPNENGHDYLDNAGRAIQADAKSMVKKAIRKTLRSLRRRRSRS